MISVTILTKNCAETLEKTLESTRSFPEVIVIDTGSCDATLEIAQKFPNVKIFKEKFIGFGPTHNVASSYSSSDWILSLDSDEVLSPGLILEINQLELDQKCVYSLIRHNFFNEKWIRWCSGWHPDRVVRLYNRKETSFTESLVHEKIIKGTLLEISLKNPLFHVPYRKIADFLSKMQHYSFLFAEENHTKQSSSLLKALTHSVCAFFKSYFLKRGFLGGKEGVIISLYNSHITFYKYLKLAEKSAKKNNSQ